jgi:shikimate dehydrogenase
MRKFGLIGFPLGHSFSKEYFTEKFEKERITDCSYENFPIESIDRLSGIISKTLELCGLNVTIPYKTEVLQYADYLETAVREIGAANVLKIKRGNSKIHISAFNSDITGIRDSLAPFLNAKIKKALILGTGGSSKAVAYTLRKMGLEVIKVSRSKSQEAVTYDKINSGTISDADLIVNTTPLGMYPDISSRPAIDYNQLSEKHVLFDLVYNPEMTTFLKMGQERGCRIISGLKMLYSQAERSWEIWNDPAL